MLKFRDFDAVHARETTLSPQDTRALLSSCFDHADAVAFTRATWTMVTDDALESALQPHLLRNFTTADRWFCHIGQPLTIHLYPATPAVRDLVLNHYTSLFLPQDPYATLRTLEDICFFHNNALFFGTVSHERICIAHDLNPAFTRAVLVQGDWDKMEEPFAHILL